MARGDQAKGTADPRVAGAAGAARGGVAGRVGTTGAGYVRFTITPGSILLVLAAVAAAVLAATVLVSARRIVSWTVACAVSAALIELLVRYLDRWVRRWVAIILVLLGIVGLAALLTFSVFHDLDHELHRLQEAAPQAAAQLERSNRVGGVAREIDLERRVTSAVEDLSSPSSGLAGEAVSSFGTYAVCGVLTLLFLSWGPRVSAAAVRQLSERRAVIVNRVAEIAFFRARRYVLMAIGQSMLVGLIGYAACRLADVPAPAPLALALAVATLLPNLGIAVGALPILLLAGGLQSSRVTLALGILFAVLQTISSLWLQPRIVRASLYVGPAVVAISFLVGFELYGLGGGLYASALGVGAAAVIDARAEVVPEEVAETATPAKTTG